MKSYYHEMNQMMIPGDKISVTINNLTDAESYINLTTINVR